MMTQKNISASNFYEPRGRVLLATTKIFNFDLQIDQDILIQNRQQNAIARDYLREYRSKLIDKGIIEVQGEPASDIPAERRADFQTIASLDAQESMMGPDDSIIKGEGMIQSESAMLPDNRRGEMTIFKRLSQAQSGMDADRAETDVKQQQDQDKTKKRRRQEMTEAEFMQTAYRDESIKDFLPQYKEYNNIVLPCKKSKLVGVILDSKEMVIYSIDCDLMIRVWDLKDGNCLRSYVIETREDQLAETNQKVISEANPKQNLKKAQIIRADSKKEFMIIAFEGGEIQINKLKTGELIYNDHHVNAIKIENEIAQMKFFQSQSKYWVAVGCWQGKVAFLSRPVVELGKQFLKFKNCSCSHQNDVLTLDINCENQLVTASLDNTVSVWDTFSAQESKSIPLPQSIAPSSTGRQIQYVRFPFKEKKLRNFLLIIMNRGQCYILETQSEKPIKYHKEDILKKEIDDSDECSQHDDVSVGECSDELNISAIDEVNQVGSIERNSQHFKHGIGKEEDSALVASAHTRKKSTAFNNSPDNIRTFTNVSRGSHYSSNQNKSLVDKLQSKKAQMKDPYIIARCSSHPAVSIEDQYLVSINETGKGKLHRIQYNRALLNNTKDLGSIIEMDLVS